MENRHDTRSMRLLSGPTSNYDSSNNDISRMIVIVTIAK